MTVKWEFQGLGRLPVEQAAAPEKRVKEQGEQAEASTLEE
jgi:hypothetical protein